MPDPQAGPLGHGACKYARSDSCVYLLLSRTVPEACHEASASGVPAQSVQELWILVCSDAVPGATVREHCGVVTPQGCAVALRATAAAPLCDRVLTTLRKCIGSTPNVQQPKPDPFPAIYSIYFHLQDADGVLSCSVARIMLRSGVSHGTRITNAPPVTTHARCDHNHPIQRAGELQPAALPRSIPARNAAHAAASCSVSATHGPLSMSRFRRARGVCANTSPSGILDAYADSFQVHDYYLAGSVDHAITAAASTSQEHATKIIFCFPAATNAMPCWVQVQNWPCKQNHMQARILCKPYGI